jgi:hypothetical protein
MFILLESELPNSLKNIGKITISFYNYKSSNPSFNIYNLEYDFNQNLIPLITSFLECQHSFITRKEYTSLDTNFIIEYPINPITTIQTIKTFGIPKSKDDPRTSFYLDIENYKEKSTIKTENRKILSLITYKDSNEIVKIYPRNHFKSTYIDNALLSKQYNIVSWKWTWGNFEIAIPLNPDSIITTTDVQKCTFTLNINITEDNKIINNKIDEVNHVLWKIHKIISGNNIEN